MKHFLLHLFLSTFIICCLHGFSQTFQWAKHLGGSGIDYANNIVSDAAGNVFGTGHINAVADFDPGPGVQNISGSGSNNIYINSLDAQGNYRWAYAFGTTGFNFGNGIAVDQQGDVYVIGDFEGTIDFDPGPGVASVTANGGASVFIVKFSNTGVFQWVRTFGGTGIDIGNGVYCGPSGNVYVCGVFQNQVNFNPSGTPVNITSNGFYDIFVAKFSSEGNLVWARGLGGSNSDHAKGLTVDADENVITTGYFSGSASFQAGSSGPISLSSVGSDDIYVHKMDANGNTLWAKNAGGNGLDWGDKVSVDANGNILAIGFFRETADFDPGPGVANFTSAGNSDGYVWKLSPQGDYVWAYRIGGSALDIAYGVGAVSSGDIFVSGTFLGTVDFDQGMGTTSRTSAGSGDVYLLKIDAMGNFQSVITYGGPSDDRSTCLHINGLNEVVISGRFSQTVDFNPPNGTNLTANGQNDVFMVKYATNCLFNAVVEQVNTCQAYQWYGQTYTSSGTYSHTSAGQNGECDTIRTLELQINTPAGEPEQVAACGPFSWNGTVYALSGTYTQLLPGSNNCDSLATLQLTVTTINTVVSLTGNTLTAQAQGLQYQWLNCNNNFEPISGATNRSYTPTASGNYAVMITDDACSDTSICVNVTITSIATFNDDFVLLYPNPTHEQVAIQSNLPMLNVEMTDLGGKIMKRFSANGSQLLLLETFEPGIYLIRVSTERGLAVKRLIVY